MSKAKAGLHTLLLVAALVGLGHLSYSSTLTARKKAHPTHKSKKQPTRRGHKAHRHATKPPEFNGATYTVIATAYQAVASQTDANPFITADNSTIKRDYSSKLHWLAVSQDLLKQGGGRIHYGDKVRVGGVSPKLDGIYTVHDTMHKRHRHRIDILSNPREKLTLSTKNVKLRLVKVAARHELPPKKPALAARRAHQGRPVATRLARSHYRGHAKRPAYLVSAIL